MRSGAAAFTAFEAKLRNATIHLSSLCSETAPGFVQTHLLFSTRVLQWAIKRIKFLRERRALKLKGFFLGGYFDVPARLQLFILHFTFGIKVLISFHVLKQQTTLCMIKLCGLTWAAWGVCKHWNWILKWTSACSAWLKIWQFKFFLNTFSHPTPLISRWHRWVCKSLPSIWLFQFKFP